MSRTCGEDIRPDFHWITPALAVGGRLPAGIVPHLAERHGLRRVVDLRAEEADDPAEFERHGIALLHLPTPDLTPITAAMLDRGVSWVRAGLDRGERVLVHCEHGIGRSALLACCVLVSLGDTPLRAIERAKAARAKVCPSPDQLHALLHWSADRCRACGAEPPVDTWDELARVAYRVLAEAVAAGDDA